MHKIVELNELNIFCEFFTISSQIDYCVMLVIYGITTVMSPSNVSIIITKVYFRILFTG